jgi:hypothetical protein
MINNKISRKIVELKEDSTRLQDYEMFAKLRDVEVAFHSFEVNGLDHKYTIEPTGDNFKKEIIKIIEYFDKMQIKSISVRELKLMLLLEF